MATPRLTLSNAQIANTVRSNAGIDYQSRIPIATQGNMEKVYLALQDYENDWNTFINGFLNKICLSIGHKSTFENKLSRFKRTGVLTGGSQIEEYAANLIKAKVYDGNATDVFGVEKPDIRVNYHTQNRRDKYKITLSEIEWSQAFTTEGGLATAASIVMDLPTQSDNWDEYLIMRNLLKLYDDVDGFFNENVPDLVNASQADKENYGKAIAEKIRMYNESLKGFYNSAYNAEGLPVTSSKLILLATPRFYAAFDVNVLSAAFNMGRTEYVGDYVVTIDDFGIDGCQAMLVDEDFFVAGDTLYRTASIFNPDNLATNYWLHHWGVYSASRFVNAIKFSTAPQSPIVVPTQEVTSVTINEPTVAPTRGGAPAILTADVVGTAENRELNRAVLWEIVGDSGKIKSTETYLTQKGELYIGEKEANTTLAIRATSLVDTTKYGEITVTIAADDPETDPEVAALLVYTKPELQEMAEGLGLEFDSRATKATLAADIVAAQGTPSDSE